MIDYETPRNSPLMTRVPAATAAQKVVVPAVTAPPKVVVPAPAEQVKQNKLSRNTSQKLKDPEILNVIKSKSKQIKKILKQNLSSGETDAALIKLFVTSQGKGMRKDLFGDSNFLDGLPYYLKFNKQLYTK